MIKIMQALPAAILVALISGLVYYARHQDLDGSIVMAAVAVTLWGFYQCLATTLRAGDDLIERSRREQ